MGVRMWTLPRACAWACAWACSLRRRGGRAHVDFAEGLCVGMIAIAFSHRVVCLF